MTLTIDTARASMTGPEESSEHVSAFLRAVRRVMATVPGAGCLLVHHAGWQDGEGRRQRERGSSAWRGNVDATLYLEAGDYDRETGTCPLTLRTLKVRDGETPPPLRLVRRRVDWGELDPRGRLITSCIVERDGRTREDVEAAERVASEAQAQAADLAVLRAVVARPDLATSQDRIRQVTGASREVVYPAIARLVRRGWLTPPERQRQPYIVTPDGRQAVGR